MKTQLTDQALNDQIAQLPDEMTPERDLWSGIERAIEQAPKQTKQGVNITPYAWAASVFAAVLVTWLSFSPQQNTTALDVVALLQNSFESQKQTMLVSYGQPTLTKLPVEMQEQLKQLAAARQSIEKALNDDPNNMDLINLLRFTQTQELNLLEQLYTPKWQSI